MKFSPKKKKKTSNYLFKHIFQCSFYRSDFCFFVIIHSFQICSLISGNLMTVTEQSTMKNTFALFCIAVVSKFVLNFTCFFCWISCNFRDSRELSLPTSSIALIPGCLINVSLYDAVLVNLLIAMNAFADPLKYHCFWFVAKACRAGIIAHFLGFLPCLPNISGMV